MLKKKPVMIAVFVLITALIIGAVVFFATHQRIGGAFVKKDAQVIDLTQQDLSEQEYLALCEQYPDTEILWSVPIQGERYDQNTETIRITSLTREDVRMLDYLPRLKHVDAHGCTDYDALMYLQQQHPECDVLYYVPLGVENVSSLSGTVNASNVTFAQLEEALPLLPHLEHLALSGKLPQVEELLKIREAYPHVKLLCTLELWGQELHTDYRKLDLSGAEVDPQQLARLLPLFPDVTEVILTGTALTVSQYEAIAGTNPGIQIVCDVDVYGRAYSTDTTEIDISGISVTAQEVEALIPLFPKLEKLIMSHCGIDDETMDALNRRHENIAIVWTVQIGLSAVRTDDIIFYPASINQYMLPSNEELQKLRYCTEMVAIDIGHSDATDCNWLAYMPHVKYLILADTQITDISPLANLKELLYVELFSLDIQDYSPLLECTALQDLNIGTTFADPEPLFQMTWLHNLLWHNAQDHPVVGQQAQELKEHLQDTNVVLKTRRKNIGSIWRFLPNYYVFRDLLGGGFYNQEALYMHWAYEDGKRILTCNDNDEKYAGDVLAEIVRYNIDNGLPIMGVKNVGSEKAEILYQSLLESQALYQKKLGVAK